MKLLSYQSSTGPRLGALDATHGVLDLARASSRLLGRELPSTLLGLIEAGEDALATAGEALRQARARPEGLWAPLAQTQLTAPIPQPRKNVFCVGRNYKAHIAEMARSFGREPNYPKLPEFFSKPPTTVVGPEAGIERHAGYTDKLDYEVELAVVIGRRGRNVSEAEALSHVFGYTVVNDISARDAQVNHHQFFKGKSFDSFCPMGPCIVTREAYGDWSGRRLSLKVNGEARQDSSTADMLFGVPRIIEALSAALTLEPGDVIATGTPQGVAQGMAVPGWLQLGDVVEAEVEGIGVLRNRVV